MIFSLDRVVGLQFTRGLHNSVVSGAAASGEGPRLHTFVEDHVKGLDEAANTRRADVKCKG